MKKPYISIVIPVFNESDRITNLKKIVTFFNRQKFNSEIIVVNDGSYDNTLELISKFKNSVSKKSKTGLKIISYKKNKGKGHAVRLGMLKACGSYRLFMDIDLSTPLKSFKKFEKFLAEYHVIIGSRKTKKAKLIQKQPFIRENLGKAFTKLSQVTLQVNVTDFTCGFKCFSEKSATNIFRRQKIPRWGFDSEILFLATRLGYEIKEIPVEWKNHPDSKVKFPNDLVNSLLELIKIRNYHRQNKYLLK